MLLTALLATFTAAALADTPTVSKASSPTKLPTVKSSTSKSVSPTASLSRPKKHGVPSEPPLIAALSSLSNKKSAPLLKSRNSSVAPHSRPVPYAARMVSIKHRKTTTNTKISLSSKSVESSSTITTYDPAKIPSYDYIEPEEIQNKLEEQLWGKSTNSTSESKTPLIKSTNKEKQITIKGKQDTENEKQVINLQQNISVASENTDDNFIKDLKKNLRRGNDDYLEKLSGRRSGNNIEIARPKHVDIRSIEKSIRGKHITKDHDHARRTHTTKFSMKTRSERIRKPQTSKFLHRMTGLTTPSKYEIKSYRKPSKSKRRHHGDKRPFGKYAKHRMRGRDHLYHVQRRHEGLETTASPLKSIEITIPADLASDLMLQPDITQMAGETERRIHIHPKLHTAPSIATRPKVYAGTTKATRRPPEPMWNSGSFKSTQKDYTFDAEEKHAARNQNSFTTVGAFERDSLKKQKKLERFVKFINKNRNLLQQFIREKKQNKAADKNSFFRGGVKMPLVKQPVHAHQLDLAPAKGYKIEALRVKSRVCQRNVMIPEGPKYNSQGETYMPAFKKKKNGPDYTATKLPQFIIPICCNCCKKSVLGCQ